MDRQEMKKIKEENSKTRVMMSLQSIQLDCG